MSRMVSRGTMLEIGEGEAFEFGGLLLQIIKSSGLQQVVYFLFYSLLGLLSVGPAQDEEVDVGVHVDVVEEAHALCYY